MMIFGMTPSTLVHVALNLLGIASGIVVLYGLLAAKQLDVWTAFFLATTVATSVTGFLFPFEHFLPSHGVGIVSLIVLAVAILARYLRHLAGAWRPIYAVSAVIAPHLNPSATMFTTWAIASLDRRNAPPKNASTWFTVCSG